MTGSFALGLAESGFGVTALIFLKATDRGVGYVGLRVPDRGRLVASVVGGAVALFTIRSVALLATLRLGGPLPPARVSAVPIAPQALRLAMLPLSLFVVGLGFGYSDERTGSIWVPVALPGLDTAMIMASGYVSVEFGVVTL